MSRGISLRPSQYLYTFGVGSLIESKNGPRLISDFSDWASNFTRNILPKIEDYRIIEPRLEQLLGGAKIFRLPTNAELGEKEETILYTTIRFPNWARCPDHNTLFRTKPDGTTRCPKCNPNRPAHYRAVRFVKACSDGHLDDVDWPHQIHGKSGCRHEIFDWIELGSTLKNIYIECKRCKARVSLSDIYYGNHPCTGRHPELGIDDDNCEREAKVILRNSSNLRVPIIETALTIPPLDTRLSRILENHELRSILVLIDSLNQSKKDIMNTLRTVSKGVSGFNEISLREIETNSEDTIKETIKGILNLDETNAIYNQIDLRNSELDRLKYAADHGWPLDVNNEERDFEVIKKDIRIIKISNNLTLRITPINRLRVVAVQKGFRRIVGAETPKSVFTSLNHNQNDWYVGMAMRGEGIFIDVENKYKKELSSTDIWDNEFAKKRDLSYHPEFVWWHTLSHGLIKSLAIDSGYSSASIRERIYPNHNETQNTGGILLYTSQRGGDGTLGGLISLVSHFDSIISTAIRTTNNCSNDPLCSETRFNPLYRNGAACYSCLFVSETSCEFGNSFLDRNLLRENL